MNKVALITGGTGGIGSAIAEKLAENNIKVYATYRGQQKYREMNLQQSNFIKCDITSKEEVEHLIEGIIQDSQKIDIIINTVTSRLKLLPFVDLTDEDFLEDINTILFGSANLYRAAIPHMKKNNSGLIINFLTEAIITFPPRMSSYVSAKCALFALLKCISSELKNTNIKIINISPFFVDTDLIKAYPPKLIELERMKLPEKRFLKPADIADYVIRIIRESEKYESGSNIILHSVEDIR